MGAFCGGTGFCCSGDTGLLSGATPLCPVLAGLAGSVAPWRAGVAGRQGALLFTSLSPSLWTRVPEDMRHLIFQGVPRAWPGVGSQEGSGSVCKRTDY